MKSPLRKAKDTLWELCKEITRLRHGHHCYTCNEYVRYPHTGHFITGSTCSTELYYDLDNLRPQCYPCNVHKSGNWVVFEEELRKVHGQEYINALKRRNQETKGKQYDILWYQKKIEEYQKIKNELSTGVLDILV